MDEESTTPRNVGAYGKHKAMASPLCLQKEHIHAEELILA